MLEGKYHGVFFGWFLFNGLSVHSNNNKQHNNKIRSKSIRRHYTKKLIERIDGIKTTKRIARPRLGSAFYRGLLG